MAVSEHPEMGTIVICNFDTDFRLPEMVKTRPVVVISPKIKGRFGLCTVVCLSTTNPGRIMPYHGQITLKNPLPRPYGAATMWIKGDMVYAVALDKIDLVRLGKDKSGKRVYRYEVLPDSDFKEVRSCVLRSIGLGILTKHLWILYSVIVAL